VAVLIGAAFGLLFGLWLGRGLTTLYAEYFRFPRLVYETSWGMIAAAVILSVFAGAVGAAQGVRSAAKLPPAEALRPSAPARFRPGPLERAGVGGRLSPASLMILRNLERRPLRAIASVTGVAFGVAVLVFGFFFLDAIDYMLDLQFRRIQREDLAVYFNTARPASIGHDLSRMSGVMRAETFRSVPVRLSNGHRSRTTALVGVPPDATIRRLVDQAARLRTVPATGVMLNATLARALDVRAGDAVRAEVLEGERRVRWVRVTATIDELVGTTAYMDDRELHTLLGQARAASGAYLRVEHSSLDSVNSQLKRLPALAGVYSPAAVRASFEQQLSENLLISITFLVSLASVLAIGVVYNGARIALSERGRELASLRVLGFTRKEVEVLLLGEQGLLTALAIPFGWVIGFAMSAWTLSAFASERYRIPFVITTRTYFWSAAVTLLAATIAGLALRRRLNRLDLVAVLKTRE
jgi:putative ABC transport system permease protein